ncbi:MAG: MFS transporter [Ideonella sp.]|nr:MFS transporter [Ideonella sp.]
MTPHDPAASTRVSARGHWTLLLLLLVYTMSFTDRQIIGILLQPIKQEFAVSDTAMGLLSGLAFALFYSVLGVPLARYADRANRRNFIAWCCGAWSVMTGLCGMATGYWSLALARVGVAVGEAGGTPPSLSMVADHYPPAQRGRAMSVYMVGPQLGIIFGLGLGGWIAQHHGWRSAFLWMSVPGLALALLLRFTGTEPARGGWETRRVDSTTAGPAAAAAEPFAVIARDLWRSTAFTRVTWAGLMLGLAGYGIGIWTPSFLVRSHGMSLQSAGLVMGLLGGLAAVAGSLIGGWLSDRLALRDARWRLGVPVLGVAIALPAGLLFYCLPAGASWTLGGLVVPQSITAYLVFGITTVWWMAPVYAALSDIVPAHRRATAMAVFNLGLTMIGGGLGPLSVGLISDLLVPAFGQEALRWALAASMSTYAVGLIALLAAVGPYAKQKAAG